MRYRLRRDFSSVSTDCIYFASRVRVLSMRRERWNMLRSLSRLEALVLVALRAKRDEVRRYSFRSHPIIM
jgi:hypothetical protein